jgi:hypothetical protein
MDNNNYPREWRAAAAILGGEAEPYIAELCKAFRSWASAPPPLPSPPKPKPLPTYVQMRICAMAWNDDLGMLEDIDD